MEAFVIRDRARQKKLEGESTVENETDCKSLFGPELLGDVQLVERLFTTAKLDVARLASHVQQMVLTEGDLGEEYRLLEVDNALLSEIEKEGGFVFRGGIEESPMLCTRNAMYHVKEAEVSNSLLLVPQLELIKKDATRDENRRMQLLTQQVVAIRQCYLELTRAERIRVTRLRELLEPSALAIRSDGLTHVENCYSFEDLLSHMQASEMQLRELIAQLPIVELHGKLRWLTFEYRQFLMGKIVDLCENDDVPAISEISITLDALLANLANEVPEAVLRWFLKHMCKEMSPGIWALDERPVCRCYAEMLLRSAVRFNWQEFWTAMERCLPVGLAAKWEHLAGMALAVQAGPRLKTIELLSVEDLPEEPQQRFEILFGKKCEWEEEEIIPFLDDITVSVKQRGELLTRFCRSTVGSDGRRRFCHRERGL